MKIGYQLKQVRERLAKGLVDKGVLRTEKRNFLLFDMATHPVADSASKDAVLRRVLALLTSASPSVHAATFYREESLGGRPPIAFRVTRALSLVCCAFSANVLENALNHLSYDAREAAFQKADEFLNEFAQWPMAPRAGGGVGVSAAPALGEGSIVTSAYAEANAGASIPELARAIRAELAQGSENQYELIAAVLHVMSRMDSLL